MKKIALYPGTFDPITNGHYDIIERALNLFDELIIAVAISTDKKPMFTLQERIHMTKEAVKNLKNVTVLGFDNLTVELAKTHNANVLIRGLRAVSDFEYELQLGYLNNSLDKSIETVYLMPKLQHAFISSSSVRNLLKFNAKTDHLLPKDVQNIIGKMNSCTLQ
ncbi:pantetheine-phosphate adenylyltransferase [Sulfurimonas sp. CVO]|jgi:pantetheine-phosphate adenylyltransferase|uniref:Phosphopantetheine adenylyltransferase n=1 Tax=Sulfurimonas xiamenensis TaxID=2590021 RepID=A0AAJ4A3L4_9BACT|nr:MULTISPECIES: pantetheine-phosphate adenylyltransferase [Sulfurimonas]PLY13978.1 MAG: pantetheine-phosphate adenylyltransferase [Sulfurimonas sp.]QFR43263.1 pantetheine-phosphate adenylyltransferase [Sulfurimonas xiamenensis]QHG91188.1 pantetheine-phosphate adenylyltransferase [Sulfurimonas sp. CVO]